MVRFLLHSVSKNICFSCFSLHFANKVFACHVQLFGLGAYRHIGRYGLANVMKEGDGSPNFFEGKRSKRGISAGHGSQEVSCT